MSSRQFGRVRAVQPFVAHSSAVRCMCLGRKSAAVLATGGDDSLVNVWRVGRPAALLSLAGHSSGVSAVDFDHKEDIIASGSEGGSIKVFDLGSQGKVIRTYQGHRSACTCIDHHPFGGYIVTGSMDTSVRLWDLRRKSCMSAYKGHSSPVTCVRFSPDGSMVASGSESGRILIWDLTAGKLLHEFKHGGGVRGLEYHPNDFLLASSGGDRCLKFWDVDRMCLIEQTPKENSSPSCIRFTPDGSELVSASSDSLRAWAWEPSRMIAHVDAPWSVVDDMRLSSARQNQLVVCSSSDSFVSAWVVNLTQDDEDEDSDSAHRNRDRERSSERNRAETEEGKESQSKGRIGTREESKHVKPLNVVRTPPRQQGSSKNSSPTNKTSANRPTQARGSRTPEKRIISPPRSPVVSPRRTVPSPQYDYARDAQRHSSASKESDMSIENPVDNHANGGRLDVGIAEEKTSFDAATSMGASFLGRSVMRAEEKSSSEREPASRDRLISELPGSNYRKESRAKYLPESNTENNPADMALVNSAMSGSSDFCKIMTDRIRETRVVARLWTSKALGRGRSGKDAAMKALSHIEKQLDKDRQLAVDFVMNTPLDMGAFDLHSCVTLLPMLSTLLEECAHGTEQWCEEHTLAIFNAVQTLYRGFGDVIQSNAEQSELMRNGGRVRTKGVDAEQRIFRATSCYDSLKRLASQVNLYVNHAGAVGRAAGELSRLLCKL